MFTVDRETKQENLAFAVRQTMTCQTRSRFQHQQISIQVTEHT